MPSPISDDPPSALDYFPVPLHLLIIVAVLAALLWRTLRSASASTALTSPHSFSAKDLSPRWALLLLLAMVAGLFWGLDPALLLADTLPAWGDTAGHIHAVDFLHDNLPAVRGWDQSWFAGYPAFYFYFPLPALGIAALSSFLSFGAAFKLGMVAGALLLPVAAYALFRSGGAPRFVSVAAAAGAVCFLLLDDHAKAGGNLLAVVIGEYSHSWSLTLTVFYLAALLAAGRNPTFPRISAAGVLLTAAVLSHFVPVLVAAVCVLALFIMKRELRRPILISGLLALGLSSFFWIPFLAYHGYGALLEIPENMSGKFLMVVDLWVWIPVILLAAAVRSIRTRRYLHTPAFFALAAFALSVVPQNVVTAYRFFPQGHLMLSVIGMTAAILLMAHLLDARPLKGRLLGSMSSSLGIVAVVVLLVVAASLPALQPRVLRNMVSWSFSGYQGWSYWEDYSSLAAELSKYPGSRAGWERARDGVYSQRPLALTALPYWGDRSFGMLSGLLLESSLTTYPARVPENAIADTSGSHQSGVSVRTSTHDIDYDLGVSRFRALGTDFVVVISDDSRQIAATRDDLAFHSSHGVYTLFEVLDSHLVEVASHTPVVYAGGDDVRAATLDWFKHGDLDRWLVGDGLDSWPRSSSATDLPADTPNPYPLSADAEVEVVEVSDEKIRFRTSALGVPHIVRVSYFPLWITDDADGPFYGAPSFMVVVPHEEEVTLTFTPGTPELLSSVVSLFTLVVLLGGAGVSFWRRRHIGSFSEQGSPDGFDTSSTLSPVVASSALPTGLSSESSTEPSTESSSG